MATTCPDIRPYLSTSIKGILTTNPSTLSPQQQQRATTPHSLPLSLAGELCVTCIANETTSCRLLCHSERSEESRIFLDANHCTLNHGSTAAKAGGSEDQCVGKSGILRFALE